MPNFLNYSDQQIEALINDVYSGVVTRDNLPVDLYEDIKRRLNKGVFEGFGGSYENFSEDTTEGLIMSGFEKNIAVFSGAKTFQQVNDMSNFLFAGSEKLPFSEFKKHANEIFDTYNDNWLKTEYNTAISQASSGRQWNDIKNQADIFPLIKFITVGDGRVRDSHKGFDNIVKPIGDPFWKKYFPPLDWNCRCTSEQLEEGDEPITDIKGRDLPEVPKLFQMNAGEDKIIFDESVHPYFKVDQRYKVALKNNFDLPFVPEVKPKGVKPVRKPKAPPIIKPEVLTAKTASEKILKIEGIDALATMIKKNTELLNEISGDAKLIGYASGEKRNELITAYNEKFKRYKEVKAEIAALNEVNAKKIIELLKVEKPINIEFDISKASISNNKNIVQQANSFSSLISETWQPVNNKLNISVSKRIKRAFFRKGEGVSLSPTNGTETVLHEIGHYLEHSRLDFHAEIMAFYNKRTAGEELRRLSTLTGNKGYASYEVAKKDNFIDPYIGKFYGREGSSEIFTMWFTELFKNPKRLIENDFEYFEFIFNLIRK